MVRDDEKRRAMAADRKRKARAAGDGKQDKKAWKAAEAEADAVIEQGLLAMGRRAYRAFIRAYSAKEKAVRHIFSSRALHVGHVARR